jgi:hypothetical protein
MNGEIPLKVYLDEKFGTVADQLKSVEANQQLLNASQQKHGQALAILPCHQHQRRLSELTEVIKTSREDSQVHIIHESVALKERQRLLKFSLAVVGVVAATVGTVWAIMT